MIILSRLADYGVILVTHLAAEPERQVNATLLSEETRLPRATVAKVLKMLAHAGIVQAMRGAAGGYRLARNAAAISVADVVAAIDGDIEVVSCSTEKQGLHDCRRLDFCSARPHLRLISKAVVEALAGVSVAQMARPVPLVPALGVPFALPDESLPQESQPEERMS